MIILYIIIGYYLYTISLGFLFIYCSFFVLTVIFQSYNCLYWKCPHVGTFCPGAGGFCVISSPLAKLLIKLNVKLSNKRYNILCSIAYINFFGIILFPVYFIFKLNFLFVPAYFGIVLLYFFGMMLLICPYCGAGKACPGGQSSAKLLKMLKKRK